MANFLKQTDKQGRKHLGYLFAVHIVGVFERVRAEVTAIARRRQMRFFDRTLALLLATCE
jgi:hypothetical protein